MRTEAGPSPVGIRSSTIRVSGGRESTGTSFTSKVTSKPSGEFGINRATSFSTLSKGRSFGETKPALNLRNLKPLTITSLPINEGPAKIDNLTSDNLYRALRSIQEINNRLGSERKIQKTNLSKTDSPQAKQSVSEFPVINTDQTSAESLVAPAVKLSKKVSEQKTNQPSLPKFETAISNLTDPDIQTLEHAVAAARDSYRQLQRSGNEADTPIAANAPTNLVATTAEGLQTTIAPKAEVQKTEVSKALEQTQITKPLLDIVWNKVGSAPTLKSNIIYAFSETKVSSQSALASLTSTRSTATQEVITRRLTTQEKFKGITIFSKRENKNLSNDKPEVKMVKFIVDKEADGKRLDLIFGTMRQVIAKSKSEDIPPTWDDVLSLLPKQPTNELLSQLAKICGKKVDGSWDDVLKKFSNENELTKESIKLAERAILEAPAVEGGTGKLGQTVTDKDVDRVLKIPEAKKELPIV